MSTYVVLGYLKQNLAHIKGMLSGGKDHSGYQQQALLLVAHVYEHLEDLPDRLQAEASILQHMLSVANDLFSISQIHTAVDEIHRFYISKNLNSIMFNYRQHVKREFSIGGGELFKQIASQDKEFLRVTHETHGGGATNPEEFLDKQKDVWSKFWNPLSPDLKYRLAEKFKPLRLAAPK